jgi:hypothetical protein
MLASFYRLPQQKALYYPVLHTHEQKKVCYTMFHMSVTHGRLKWKTGLCDLRSQMIQCNRMLSDNTGCV